MFTRGIRLPFRLMGIPVILDWTFLLILPLLAFIIGSQAAPLARMLNVPNAGLLEQGSLPYLLGLIAALGLFAGVVLHELGHAVAARLYGVKVRSISLWFLGGVARFDEMPRRRGAEAVVAVVGPLVSLALAGACWLLLFPLPETATASQFVIKYLVYVNIVIAIFNMIPALPLDGGRVLRSLLALRLPYARATSITATISRGFAILIGLFGLLSFNFFLLLIAVFIYMAVSAETVSGQVEEALRHVPVRDMVNRDVHALEPDLPIAELGRRVFEERHSGFPVADEAGRPLGWVSIYEVQGQDPDTPVAQVMSRETPQVSEHDEAIEAYRRMSQTGRGRVLVVDDDGRLSGIITKTDLMRTLGVRSLTDGSRRHWPAPDDRWARTPRSPL